MALTKIGKEGITGISNASDATFLTATSGEGVTLAGTLAVTGVHTVGNNAVITSEGGAVTTNLGLAVVKVFVNYADNASINDSLNVSSITDGGTGVHTINIANDMANAVYTCLSGGGSYSEHLIFAGRNAGSFPTYGRNNTSDSTSVDINGMAAVVGDLA